MTANITADILQKYVETNEVVFQYCGELVEVSNDTEKENKENAFCKAQLATRN